jgi:hypothetical protein
MDSFFPPSNNCLKTSTDCNVYSRKRKTLHNKICEVKTVVNTSSEYKSLQLVKLIYSLRRVHGKKIKTKLREKTESNF